MKTHPSSGDIIGQIKELGLKVGDTIESLKRESGECCDVRLTLLWVGQSVAVWQEKSRRSNHKKWVDEGESANWTLDMRKWRKVKL